MKILKDKGKSSDPAIAGDVSAVIDRLVGVDLLLAEIALEDAQTALAGLVPDDKKAEKVVKEIENVEKELAKAQEELDKGHSDHAIKHANK